MRAAIRRKKTALVAAVTERTLEVDFQNEGAFADRLPDNACMHKWMAAACERNTEVVVRFVDAKEGRELNNTYRHKDYATNVLTFDYSRTPIVTADLVICVPVLEREAAEQNKTFEEHLAHLLVHGILHAHGYDHLAEDEAEIMEARETEIMLKLGFANPYSDRIGMVHD